MSVQITIIGLGQIGASIGLALADQKDQVKRVGHDKEPAVARRAKEIGAIDGSEFNLHRSVEKAEVVILALPIDQVRETLEWIAPDLQENCVILDTAPAKEAVASWAAELLPADRHYIGLIPVLNPAYLNTTGSGIELAHADLFNQGLLAIVSSPRANSSAVKLAADLATLLGAAPYFADTAELDGLMATTYLLPQILAAAMLDTTVDQPGWREARKIAGRGFLKASAPAVEFDTPKALARAANLNQTNTLRAIDNLVSVLADIRAEIQGQDETALAQRIERVRDGRNQWWKQRLAGDWLKEELAAVEMPRATDIFGNLIGLRRKPKK